MTPPDVWTLYRSLPREIKDHVEDYLSQGDLYDMSMAGPLLRAHARAIFRRRFARLLRRFRLPVLRTLRMMQDHNSAISGSGAVAMVNPGHWSVGDLDFYCPKGEVLALLDFFRDTGYRAVATTAERASPNPIVHHIEGQADRMYQCNAGLRQVFTMVHATTKCRIQVIESMSLCPVLPMLFFHSTIVMNYITSSGVTCCYPSSTLNYKGLLNVQLSPPTTCVPPQTQCSLDKYEARGYSIYDRLNVGAVSRRWNDLENLFLGFESESPPMRPSFSWTLAYRVWDSRYGYLQHDPRVTVETDGGAMYYSNCQGAHYLGPPVPYIGRVY